MEKHLFYTQEKKVRFFQELPMLNMLLILKKENVMFLVISSVGDQIKKITPKIVSVNNSNS